MRRLGYPTQGATEYPGRLALRCLKAGIGAMAKAIPAWQYASAQAWADRDEVVGILKASVAGSDVDGGYSTRGDAVDFLDAVRQVSVLDRIGARRLPAHTRLLGLDGIAVSGFVNEGKPIPVYHANMAGFVLEPAKVAGIVIVSNEAIDSADVDIERALADMLAQGLAAMTDQALLNPDGDGSDGNPVSITYGADTFASAGATLANIDSDIQRAVRRMVDHGSSLSNVRWVLRPETATYLATLRGTAGAPAFPGIGPKGGQIVGLDAIVSAAVPTDNASPASSLVALVDGDAIAYTDAGAEMRRSQNATIESADDPTGATDTPVAATKYLVSMFQENCTAIKVLRRVNWERRRDSVVCITDVTY